MNKIFTRTGDAGVTGRYDGVRVPKNDPLIEVNGAIDECNSFIGVARSFIEDEHLREILKNIQNLLMVTGSEITNVKHDERLPALTEANVLALEELIDELGAGLSHLNHFILPAGGKASAHLHLARTASRKVERRLVSLCKKIDVNTTLLIWFNRLSDTLFVLARHAAKLSGQKDEVWINPRSHTE